MHGKNEVILKNLKI